MRGIPGEKRISKKVSESVQKKLEKSFKKVLTSTRQGDIIYRLSARQQSSLKIEQQDNAISLTGSRQDSKKFF